MNGSNRWYDIDVYLSWSVEPLDGEDRTEESGRTSIGKPGLDRAVKDGFDAGGAEIVVVNHELAVESGIDERGQWTRRRDEAQLEQREPGVVETTLERWHHAMRRGLPMRRV